MYYGMNVISTIQNQYIDIFKEYYSEQYQFKITFYFARHFVFPQYYEIVYRF